MSIKTLAEDNIKEITEGIIRDMESHDMTQPFVPKWITNLHMNVDGYQYTGWNQFHLNYKYGYSTPIWGTYNQWNKIGLHPAPRSGRPLWQPMTFKTEDKKTGKETFTTINESHHPISKRTKDRKSEKERFKSGRIYDGRSRIPSPEYKENWNEIFGNKND